MILSMTGFGKASATYKDEKINIELKSLNGKTADIRFKLSHNFREKEVLLRNLILDHAVRGKIECNVSLLEGDNASVQLNKGLFRAYLTEVLNIENEIGVSQSNDLSSAILRIPNVVIANEEEMHPEKWEAIKSTMIQALDQLRSFRQDEGKALKQDLEERIGSIVSYLDEIPPFETERIDSLRTRMSRHLEEFMGKETVDKNRYEQEVLYYLEKLDINEEKVRLAQHCDYFNQVMNTNEKAIGRKLSFIAQEMGREINTLGAKAQHAEIQKRVVGMKDDLEKIKEQLANIV